MPPLVPLADLKAGPRQRHPGTTLPVLTQRSSASFHGLPVAEQQQHKRDDLLRQRPQMHPDLLADVRDRSSQRTGTGHGGDAAAAARVPGPGARGRAVAPSKVLVTVAVQQSMWPLHVMARAEWSVADLIVAVVGLYVREGRRPLLPSGDPSAFGLHYSQFSLQGLDPDEKVVELGSRSFFLYPQAAAAAAASSSSHPSTEAGKTMATSPKKLYKGG